MEWWRLSCPGPINLLIGVPQRSLPHRSLNLVKETNLFTRKRQNVFGKCITDKTDDQSKVIKILDDTQKNFQLNVEVLSKAKCDYPCIFLHDENTDVLALQETPVHVKKFTGEAIVQ